MVYVSTYSYKVRTWRRIWTLNANDIFITLAKKNKKGEAFDLSLEDVSHGAMMIVEGLLFIYRIPWNLISNGHLASYGGKQAWLFIIQDFSFFYSNCRLLHHFGSDLKVRCSLANRYSTRNLEIARMADTSLGWRPWNGRPRASTTITQKMTTRRQSLIKLPRAVFHIQPATSRGPTRL